MKRIPNNEVVILITAHKPILEPFEKISLKQCFRILGRHPIRLICPKGMDTSQYSETTPEIEVDFIDPIWQSTYDNFARMKVSPFLYRRYKNFRFILFYELDAFVFSDQLKKWCASGYDYIGAPWFEGYEFSQPNSSIVGAGNGGFCLRNTQSHLKVGKRFSYIIPPKKILKNYLGSKGKMSLGSLLLVLKKLTIQNNTFSLFNDYGGPEDRYWANIIRERFAWFKVAEPEAAMKFSFEGNPRILFERNNFELPFGCHAWWKYDLQFWKPHIEQFGYDLSQY